MHLVGLIAETLLLSDRMEIVDFLKVWFLYPLIVVLLVVFIMKFVTFLSVIRSIQRKKIEDDSKLQNLDEDVYAINYQLGKYLYILPLIGLITFLCFLFLFSYAAQSLELHGLSFNDYGNFDIMFPYYSIIQQRAIDCIVATRILMIYGIVWIFFYRWKKNILRKLKLDYYHYFAGGESPVDSQK
jgi:hypothetical protein